MTEKDAAAIRWLEGQKGAMLALLEELVNIDSGSYDKAGVDAVGARIAFFLAEHGVSVTTIPMEDYGDALRAQVAGSGGGNRPIVLMGHRDTVFPKGEVAHRPFRIAEGRAYGPGVADMKAGLVMNAFVLAAFHRAGGAPVPLVGLFTSDEEIGSPACRPIIEETARGARAVLNAEPGRPTGNVVTGRKGGVFMHLEVHGRAAHSGGNYADGRSAIGELAHKIIALHAITDLDRGITVNIGLISGGQSVNTVAPRATCEIDLRYVTPPDRDAAMSRIAAIVSDSTVPDTRAQLTIKGEFLPLVQDDASRALFETYARVSAQHGARIAGEFAGGCADSGFTASVGCPTLCAVGPVGGKAHSPEEYLEVASLVSRARAIAETIAAAARA
ncbi:M20 family metallopeptidase [Methylobacterium pseudosasicola]|uniref:Glutamate carboxypeptidase n=1 Tax=Methylobacterium pseudosasicola TaxID=582667 RepID=A0A1I4M0K6_9HYPH|nr:M20 family metallopeptidase [Methylobacterium pseudosasicola]SFL96781.1 glutamate carboxypeptidase [Methylobacterium pseudosasicola]